MKTIDVMEGDRFERTQTTVYQYRDGKCRGISDRKVDEWWPDADTDDEFEITRKSAEHSFQHWGYTITTAENPVVCSKCRTFGCDHHNLDAAKPEAKPADVPVVDAVWVEGSFGDGKTFLTPHPTVKGANGVVANIRKARNGTARIVRIRPDADAIKAVVREMMEGYSATDHNARAMADDAKIRAADAIELASDARERGRKANERLAALESRLAALDKPATQPAARVVKAPTTPDTGPMSNERFHGWSEGWCQADERWRAAVKDAGLTIADEGSKT